MPDILPEMKNARETAPLRRPVAQGFYPGDCRRQMEAFLSEYEPPPGLPQELIGAILPHAGWTYSGEVAARTLYTLAQRCTPSSCIIFGTDHTGLTRHALYPRGVWSTPLGELEVDEDLAKRIVGRLTDLVMSSSAAHEQEHSIEVLTPMLKYLWPAVRLVPIIVRPVTSARELGRRIAATFTGQEGKTVWLASSDLTHYGSLYGFQPSGLGVEGYTWMRANDRRIVDKMCALEVDQILPEAAAHHNTCGAGAISALLAALAELGIQRGHLVQYTTSHGEATGEDFTYGVGYAGIVY